MSMRHRCKTCNKMTAKWEGSSGFYTCYDGCYSTTGYDHRTMSGKPLWEMTPEERKMDARARAYIR